MAIFCAARVILATPEMHAQEIPFETLQLAHIRDHMVEQLRRQPNYTCVETVERSARPGAKKNFQLKDTLRMEVALVDGKEMFAWPGAKEIRSDRFGRHGERGRHREREFRIVCTRDFSGQQRDFRL